MDSRQLPIDTLLLDKMRKHLGIRIRLEKASSVLKLLTQLSVVHDLTIVGQREIT